MRAVRVAGGLAGSLLTTAAVAFAGTAAANITEPPEISKESVTHITEQRAAVSATIAPHGNATSYEIWLSYGPCQGGLGECGKPVVKEQIGAGTVSAKKKAQTVKAKVQMLTPGCTYEYWFVASNSSGTTESEPNEFKASGGTTGPKECKR